MKRIYIILTLLFIVYGSISAKKPFEQGSMFLSGSSSFTKFGGDAYTDTKIFTFNSHIGFCIAKNFYFSPGFAYMHTKTQLPVYQGWGEYLIEDVTFSEWGLSPALEFYFVGDKDVKKGISVPYFSIVSVFNGSGDIHINQYGGAFGVLYFVSDVITFDFALQFTHDKSDQAIYGYPYNSNSRTGRTIKLGFGVKGFI